MARTTVQGNIILLCLFALQVICVYLTMWSQDLLHHFKPALYANILSVSLCFILFVKGISYALQYVSYERSEKGLNRIKADFLAS